MRWLGPVLVLGGAAAGVAFYMRPDSWDEPISGLTNRFTGDSTSTQGGANAGPSRAQVLQDLRRDEAEIDRALSRARDQYEELRRQTVSRSIGDVPEDVLHDGCTFWNNPYGACNHSNMQDWIADEERKLERRRREARERVADLERDLEVVRAEIDSVVLTR